MSFITDELVRTDAQLGRIQIDSKSNLIATASQSQHNLSAWHGTKRTEHLEAAIKVLSNASSGGKIIDPRTIGTILTQAGIGQSNLPQDTGVSAEQAIVEAQAYNDELEWILVGKTTTQVQAWLLQVFLKEIAPVMDDIYYWDGVLGSWRWSAVYMIQRIPEKIWDTSKDVVGGARKRLQQLQAQGAVNGLSQQWKQFYNLVQEGLRQRNLDDVEARLVSPVSIARWDASARLKGLQKQKAMCAAAIGILSNESMVFDLDYQSPEDEFGPQVAANWKGTICNSVKLMSSVLLSVTNHNVGTADFEDRVFTTVNSDAPGTSDIRDVYQVLVSMLDDTVPEHMAEYLKHRRAYGRPSWLVRYWIPALALTLSSSTLLRIFVARRAEILTWIRELGQTTIDFWYNWVVEPIKHVIGTIRHDESSEIALMSRESLEGDRASLERMVVDFAVDNPDTAGGGPLNESQIAQVREKVRAGDLTPVLRAYEYDLKKPLARAVTGNLIRELLIQIQKTKVDVEVAMSGIDALLKSQELVFGFVSLTPGILVCVAFGRWLSSTFGGRKGRNRGKQTTRMIRILRKIDRILTDAVPQENREMQLLTYADHGLVLSEVMDLQHTALKVLPGEIYRDFVEDLGVLTGIQHGIRKQIKVVERLRWAYWKWIR